jgi:molecular chaperone GrpE
MANDDQRQMNTPENAGPGEAPSPPQTEAAGNGQEQSVEEQLRQELERSQKLTQETRELQERLLRTAAEFENFKKRTKKELDDAGNRGREQLLKELLPAMDNIQRALQHAPAGDPLAVGIQQTEKQFLQALEKFGVTRFASVGKPFDPSIHDAIQQVETSDVPPGSVAQEFATGYMIGPRLLRPAMVAVAKPPANGGGAGDGSGGDGGGASSS